MGEGVSRGSFKLYMGVFSRREGGMKMHQGDSFVKLLHVRQDKWL